MDSDWHFYLLRGGIILTNHYRSLFRTESGGWAGTKKEIRHHTDGPSIAQNLLMPRGSLPEVTEGLE